MCQMRIRDHAFFYDSGLGDRKICDVAFRIRFVLDFLHNFTNKTINYLLQMVFIQFCNDLDFFYNLNLNLWW